MKIAVGPLLFGWTEQKISEFYMALAEQTEADIFYLGEVVCSKRSISGVPWQVRLAERLQQSGKEIVLSTLAMPTTEAELQSIRDIVTAAAEMGLTIEANDLSAVAIASEHGIAFVAGPHLNLYSNGTVRHLCKQGAIRIVPPLELPASEIPTVVGDIDVQVEYFAHGHLPLTFSARCYAARAHGLSKQDCRHVCFMNPDGIEMDTLDAHEFATINGTQVMSYQPFSTLNHISDLANYGVDVLRISPQSEGTAEVIRQYRDVITGSTTSEQALQALAGDRSISDAFCNGYYYGKQGRLWLQGE
jgi:collagenase-like PrtC family protease